MSAALTQNEIVVPIAVAALSASKRMTASCSSRGEPEDLPLNPRGRIIPSDHIEAWKSRLTIKSLILG
jgi:hypothetical protein